MNEKYQLGGSLPSDANTYVKRQVDEDLYQALLAGQFCYALGPRQMGQSSLMIRTTQRLQEQDVICVIIDLSMMGSKVTLEEWYFGIIHLIIRSFKKNISFDLEKWWKQNQTFAPAQRLSKFFEDILLVEIQKSIVIFIDEIDCVLSLDFSTDDFFGIIRRSFDRRTENPDYQRLTFALFGVSTPSDLIQDKRRSPFTIGKAIELTNFQISEVEPLSIGLENLGGDSQQIIGAILHFTGGQPFLTQKLCHLVLQAGEEVPQEKEFLWVEALVQKHIIEHWEDQDKPQHLRTILHQLLMRDQKAQGKLLALYQRILDKESIKATSSELQTELQLTGLVIKHEETLQIYNPIYADIFDRKWLGVVTATLPYSIVESTPISQSFNNDAVQGKDLLGIQLEVNALAEVLGMRALTPPLAVGILGGWGSGKSFVMHLMRQRLKTMSRKSVSQKRAWNNESDELSPYVGHIYQIYFNSWTYAKADLWSSLMQTIFYELNHQLTIETHLRHTFAIKAAIAEFINLIFSDYEDTENSDYQTIKVFIIKLIENRKKMNVLLQILYPKFWQQCSDSYLELEKEIESRGNNSSNQSHSKELEELKPLAWKDFAWDSLKQEIDNYFGVGATEKWKAISCQKLHHIWIEAQQSALNQLRGGGEIWKILDSDLTANERDEVVKAEKSLDESGFMIWQELISQTRTQGVIWEELSNLREHDQKELISIENSLLTIEKNLESQQKIAELTAQKKLEHQKTTIIWQPILNQAYRLLGIDPSQVENWKTLLTKLKHSGRTYIALACLAAFIVIGASPSWSERLAALRGIIHTYLNIGRMWLAEKYTTYWPASFPLTGVLVQRIWATAKQYLNEVKQAQAQLEVRYQRWLLEEQENSNISALSQELEGLRLQAEQKRREVGLIGNQSSLLDFVNNRLQEDSYGRHLGLIHQISRDLDGLSKRLVCKGQDVSSEHYKHICDLFPRGPARVILYIDDLDRCPPDRVVDILEAIQLLINTPLFVVVLAIDDRYIARALENAYKGVLKRGGSPSGIDYLEKIIQIPYRTRPIAGDAIGTYLESHIEIEEEEALLQPTQSQQEHLSKTPLSLDKSISEVDAKMVLPDSSKTEVLSEQAASERHSKPTRTVEPPPPQVVKFTSAEIKTLKNYCQEVDISPRTAKRLINIYKILKILWYRSNRDQLEKSEDIKKLVLAILVLSGRYPTFMREVLAEISRYYEEQRHKQRKQSKREDLKDYFIESLNHLGQTEDPYLKREYEKFINDVESIIEPLDLNLSEVSEANFNLALSFCFVGDIGYDPEDYHVDENAENFYKTASHPKAPGYKSETLQ